jgi:hypothetical protein
MTAAQADHEKITRDDLEGKFRELAGDVNETTDTVKSYAVAVAAVVVVGIVALAFIAGRRRGRAKTTVVEIKRI